MSQPASQLALCILILVLLPLSFELLTFGYHLTRKHMPISSRRCAKMTSEVFVI